MPSEHSGLDKGENSLVPRLISSYPMHKRRLGEGGQEVLVQFIIHLHAWSS